MEASASTDGVLIIKGLFERRLTLGPRFVSTALCVVNDAATTTRPSFGFRSVRRVGLLWRGDVDGAAGTGGELTLTCGVHRDPSMWKKAQKN